MILKPATIHCLSYPAIADIRTQSCRSNQSKGAAADALAAVAEDPARAHNVRYSCKQVCTRSAQTLLTRTICNIVRATCNCSCAVIVDIQENPTNPNSSSQLICQRSQSRWRCLLQWRYDIYR